MSEFTWVKRATAAEKAGMRGIVAAHNEISQKEHAGNEIYVLERAGDAWGIGVTYLDSGMTDGGSFVRCTACGDIDDLWDGQEYGCWECFGTGIREADRVPLELQ